MPTEIRTVSVNAIKDTTYQGASVYRPLPVRMVKSGMEPNVCVLLGSWSTLLVVPAPHAILQTEP